MRFWEIFVSSIKLPTKEAMFKLNRVGMDFALFYMFILLFIVSTPALFERITVTTGIAGEMNLIFKVIYFFIFYYLPMSLIVLGCISLVAYIGTFIAKLMQRKLRYAIIWKLISFTTTIPLLVYTVMSLVYSVSNTYLLLALVYSISLLIIMISLYPKRRVRS
ncbi:hypothetical protein [Oceanobacillus chungangensis]|uniref:DUF1189 domain-containing protein n=1 Tax=Oceanobacillus chungangensis TaxID=1229152 RepID=A0A3D8PNP6_9BACI|nr:hypothetical protein [Oceanobacillus chungangensis]RDW16775.1 hypothetical protein CWR45_14225 [Oceanobacillus chungangensis]